MADLGMLEASLGHDFADKGLLTRALTHASKSRDNYERMEFLGDRVLGLIMAEWLCELYPVAREGELAKSLAALVSRESLAEIARTIQLAHFINLSAGDTAQRDNPTILSDVCEALVAALYLDGGLEPARAFIRRHWRGLLGHAPDTGDTKTRLQEWTQARQLGVPHYALVERSGPDHAPRFIVEISIPGLAPRRGEGASKRLAERAAAEAMMQAIETKS